MAKLKILLLYFVLPILLFATFVLFQVGAQHFGVAMMLAGAVVFILWAWMSTTPREREEWLRADADRQRRLDEERNAYYVTQQSAKHRHH
ncbi:hypothetical protein BJG93_27360 [Paraburkholderia sprentiae WSM5005]|uniref:Uncharacterized protein n=1 Tax=Paraburkholderia sprentiae WSM5005 TaxID=754502 RepID=A0A1I9YS19_9BURK|nr:hypothetical protein [Paraburkholderia sprentiae]APA88988.1 hypothetical protein BJG93_27360 [Paraburkholderia sprentiae WSM5005]